MISEAARQAGARIIATGDTAQLGAVQAGGMFRLLASEVPAAELHEVRRFARSVGTGGQRPAPRRRPGRGRRLRPARPDPRRRPEAAYERAASMWLADHLRGKDVLLLAGSNAEAADLSRRVQAKLTQLGHVGPLQATLADGNHAGVGDLIRARLNTKIDAGGSQLTNRDTLKVTALRGPDAEARRQRPDGTWTDPFRVSRSYLADHAELAYAGNIHVAQGRTVDTAHLLVTESLSRQALYVGMTRGRESNTAHVVTGQSAPPGQELVPAGRPRIRPRRHHPARQRRPVRHRTDPPGPGMARRNRPPADPVDRHGPTDPLPKHRPADQSPAHRTRKLALRPRALPQNPPAAAPRRPAGRPRRQRPHRPDHQRPDGWRPVDLQRPAPPPTAARPAPARRPRGDLGPADTGRCPSCLPTSWPPDSTTGPGPSANRWPPAPTPGWPVTLASVAANASPALREEYARRAAAAAAYREAAGITDPQQAVSFLPHRTNPELEDMRLAAIRALEIRDESDIIRGMTYGQLESRTLEAERAQASAPPDVSRQLRLTAQAEADAWQQSAEAAIATTKPKPQARRRLPTSSPPSVSSSRSATPATSNGPQPPLAPGKRPQKPEPSSSAAATSENRPNRHSLRPKPSPKSIMPLIQASSASTRPPSSCDEPRLPEQTPRPELTPQHDSAAAQEPDGRPSPDHQAARADELLAQAAAAAGRIAAEHAEPEARSEYTARLEREAQTQPEPTLESQAQWDVEMEL